METEAPHPTLKPKTFNASHPNLVYKAILGGVLLILVIGGSFMAGVHYQKGKVVTTTATASQQAMTGRGGPSGGYGGRGGMRNGTIGSVTAVSATSITVNDQRSGTSKTYAITSTTAITKDGATATYSDIASGDTVLVTASSTTTTDAARILIINPSFGGGFGTGTTQDSQNSVDPSQVQSN